MSEAINASIPEAVPYKIPAKRLTFADFAGKVKKTNLEIWLTLLRKHYSHNAMSYEDWLAAIEKLGKERA